MLDGGAFAGEGRLLREDAHVLLADDQSIGIVLGLALFPSALLPPRVGLAGRDLRVGMLDRGQFQVLVGASFQGALKKEGRRKIIKVTSHYNDNLIQNGPTWT